MADFKIAMGTKVRCKISGYEGIITGRTEWLYGCLRYTVQSPGLKDGKPIDAIGSDEDALEVVGESIAEPIKARGGPTREPERARDVSR